MPRDARLQRLLDLSEAAIARRAPEGSATARAAAKVFGALRDRHGEAAAGSSRLPVCRHLGAVYAVGAGSSTVSGLLQAFTGLELELRWRRRTSADPRNRTFWDGHANAMIVGPGGLEARQDVWAGVSLMAPHTVYVDHDHPPEEVYLALSDGAWWNADMDWTEPGPGGLIYNRPGIRHAMRAGAQPFLALWFLPVTVPLNAA